MSQIDGMAAKGSWVKTALAVVLLALFLRPVLQLPWDLLSGRPARIVLPLPKFPIDVVLVTKAEHVQVSC